MTTRSCGCVINNQHIKIKWCSKHNKGLPDIYQTEEYYH